MAPTYAPMIPPQPHHIVQYGNINPPVAPTQQQQQQPPGGHMGTPNPSSNTIPYYHHPTQPQPHSTPPPQHPQQRQSSPGSHSSASGKKPNLRVEIPSETQNNETATTTTTTAAITTTTAVVAANGPPPTASFAPPSALPSQFAHNLPSPSTFYPEFYQQNELPSPLNFSSTPISGGTSFHWPSRGSISGPGGTEYKPSPLAKM